MQQDKGKFTLLWFYERRIRRIFPALFVVMLATAVIGSLVMAPDDFNSLGGSIFATSIFSSNILFWWRSGYFDTPAEVQPLLHTWSLTVEEQFYLAFPLLMMLLLNKTNKVRVITIFGSISFLSAAILVFRSPISDFYLFPFRAWELIFGSILAMRPVPLRNYTIRNYCSALGLAMIFAAIFLFSRRTLFPGVAALLPTVGTALFIWAGEDTLPITNRLSAIRSVVFVGKISYSFYLWHFVLLAFGSYLSIGTISPERVTILLALSFAPAVLSYYAIEQPVRRATFPLVQGRALLCLTGSAIGGLALIGWTIRANEGFDASLTVDQRKLTSVLVQTKCTPMSLSRAVSHQFCKFGTASSSEPAILMHGYLTHFWMRLPRDRRLQG